MNLIRLKAIAVKEMLQIWRDPRSLMLVLLMPFLQMLMLGYGVTLDIKHVPICVFDREGSQASQDLLKRFAASDYFEITAVLADYPALVKAVDVGQCRMAVVVPNDFSLRLNDSGASSIQAIVDATDDNTANIAINYAQAVIAGYSSEIQLDAQGRRGQVAANVPVVVQSRVWFNEDLSSRNFIIPGVVAMVMALVGSQLTSLTIAREWERGTMELLVSTPVTPMELLLGKLVPYLGIGLLDAAFCLSIAVWWFDVPFRGTLFTLFMTSTLFLIVVLSIGYLISVLIRNQVGASQIALAVTLLPTNMLSGFIFPIDQMPNALQAITYLVFGRYYITILKSVFLKGSGMVDLLGPIAALVIYAAATAFLAARAFRKSLD